LPTGSDLGEEEIEKVCTIIEFVTHRGGEILKRLETGKQKQ